MRWWIGLAVALSSSPSLHASTKAPPNIVVVLADDLGAHDLGCTGSTYHETPHLDRLAKRGMLFTSGYSSCPVCSPTRAALMTGRHPARLNITDWLPGRADRPSQRLLRPPIRQQLPLDEVTLARLLRGLGYTSACIGKWHLGGAGFLPTDHGFDVNIGGTQAGSPTGGYFGFKSPTLTLAKGEYLTDRLTDEACRFIARNKAKPFFLYLAHYAVHIPIQPRPDILARFEKNPRPRTGQNNPHYAALLASLDASVGRVLDTLDELKLADNTLVVFTSDNGGLSVVEGMFTPATSNAPLRTGKGYLYEGGIRVPLLIAGPGIRAGSTSAFPVASTDVFPTVAELTGARLDARRTLDGVSILGLLRGGAAPRREALFWHYPHYANQGSRPGGAVRVGPLKLIESYEDDRVELYDLSADSGEATDLAAKQPARAADLRRRLHTWRREVGAKMPTPNPDYKAKDKK